MCFDLDDVKSCSFRGPVNFINKIPRVVYSPPVARQKTKNNICPLSLFFFCMRLCFWREVMPQIKVPILTAYIGHAMDRLKDG